MAAAPKQKYRRAPTKRVRYAAVITRYVDAFTRAKEAGKLDPKFENYYRRITAAQERYLQRLRAHEPAVQLHLNTLIYRLEGKLFHYVWIKHNTDAERQRLSHAAQSINAFVDSSPSLKAKLYALARLRAIFRSGKALLKAYDAQHQKRFIQRVQRLAQDLKTRTF